MREMLSLYNKLAPLILDSVECHLSLFISQPGGDFPRKTVRYVPSNWVLFFLPSTKKKVAVCRVIHVSVLLHAFSQTANYLRIIGG